MEAVPVKFVPRGFGETYRRDAWWVEPLIVFMVLRRFRRLCDVGGVPERALHLRPVSVAVLLAGAVGRLAPRLVRAQAGWWPALAPFSPALLILPFPGLFRFTCYYYRGAYYKAFWADPLSCAVGEPRGTLPGRATGSRWSCRTSTATSPTSPCSSCSCCPTTSWLALWFTNPATGQTRVRHRPRHARPRGQRRAPHAATRWAATRSGTWSAAVKDEVSKSPMRAGLLQLLERAQRPAHAVCLVSLFSVALSDVYVRLCSMGILTDVRIL